MENAVLRRTFPSEAAVSPAQYRESVLCPAEWKVCVTLRPSFSLAPLLGPGAFVSFLPRGRTGKAQSNTIHKKERKPPQCGSSQLLSLLQRIATGLHSFPARPADGSLMFGNHVIFPTVIFISSWKLHYISQYKLVFMSEHWLSVIFFKRHCHKILILLSESYTLYITKIWCISVNRFDRCLLKMS